MFLAWAISWLKRHPTLKHSDWRNQLEIEIGLNAWAAQIRIVVDLITQAHVAAQIVTDIGFIGAGLILVAGTELPG